MTLPTGNSPSASSDAFFVVLKDTRLSDTSLMYLPDISIIPTYPPATVTVLICRDSLLMFIGVDGDVNSVVVQEVPL